MNQKLPTLKGIEKVISPFLDSTQQEKFMQALFQGEAARPAIVWTKAKPIEVPFSTSRLADWQPEFVDAVDPAAKVAQNELHTKGYYYSLDFSSVFSASALQGITENIQIVIDLCAAPGGKSILAWMQVTPELLLSNEVIAKRTGSLISNLQRCGIAPAIVTRLDPNQWSAIYPCSADLVLVDAPCSGQSLVAKGVENPGAFNPHTIAMNAKRQKRIISNAAKLVKPGGYLCYMTCTFSIQENEQIVEWLRKRFPGFKSVELPHLQPYQSKKSTEYCYRLWPQQGLGVGCFTTLLRNEEENQVGEPQSFRYLHRLWES
jgi:16S rRNA C967 or C1407 C5-methylase (RsmB/RsmF family)